MNKAYMSDRDASKELERQITCGERGKEFSYSLEPLKIAAAALSKQIPMKPIRDNRKFASGYNCPACRKNQVGKPNEHLN